MPPLALALEEIHVRSLISLDFKKKFEFKKGSRDRNKK